MQRKKKLRVPDGYYKVESISTINKGEAIVFQEEKKSKYYKGDVVRLTSRNSSTTSVITLLGTVCNMRDTILKLNETDFNNMGLRTNKDCVSIEIIDHVDIELI